MAVADDNDLTPTDFRPAAQFIGYLVNKSGCKVRDFGERNGEKYVVFDAIDEAAGHDPEDPRVVKRQAALEKELEYFSYHYPKAVKFRTDKSGDELELLINPLVEERETIARIMEAMPARASAKRVAVIAAGAVLALDGNQRVEQTQRKRRQVPPQANELDEIAARSELYSGAGLGLAAGAVETAHIIGEIFKPGDGTEAERRLANTLFEFATGKKVPSLPGQSSSSSPDL